MFNVGTGEMVLICVVALLVLGPKRLPETARSIGRFFRNLRRQTDSVRSLVQREFLSMDLEDNNKTALDSMASSSSADNPPLSPAPTFPTTTPAEAIPWASPKPGHAPTHPPSPADMDPYRLLDTQPSPLQDTPMLTTPPPTAPDKLPPPAPMSPLGDAKPSPTTPGGQSALLQTQPSTGGASPSTSGGEPPLHTQQRAASREAELDSLFSTWLENRPVPAATTLPAEPEEAPPSQQEGKKV